MVRMMVIMGLVTRKITGAQTIQVIDDIDDDGDNIVANNLLVTLIQIWVNIIYDKKSPFCEPLVFFWENTCKTSQELQMLSSVTLFCQVTMTVMH